nr:flagellar hook-length control protein FliK [uncultured Anaerocolumna sp.]
MVAQGVQSVSARTNSYNSASGKKSTEGSAFDSIINDSLKFNDIAKNHVSQKQQNKNLSEYIGYSKEDTNIQKTNIELDKAKNIKNQNAMRTGAAKITNGVSDSTNVESEAAKALKELEDTVKKALKLTDEEYTEAMEILGLTTIDLLNLENLKQLLLTVNGAEDITEVLTNENLANSMDSLLQEVNKFLELNEELLKELQAKNLFDRDSIEELMSQGDIQKTTQPDHLTDEKVNGSQESKKAISGIYGDIEVIVEKEENIPVSGLGNGRPEEFMNSISSDTQSLSNGEKGQLSSANSNLLDESAIQDDSVELEGNSKENELKLEPLNDMNSFINNLTTAALAKDYVDGEQITDTRTIHDIANQILEHLKVTIKPDVTSMELQLNPEHLGKVGLTILSKDGSLTAQFTAQTEMAREAIESQMHVLLENLNNQGLKVESIEVAVSNFTFDESSQAAKGEEQQSNSRNRNHFRSDEEILGSTESVSELNDIASEILGQNGSIIDYST